MNKLEEYLYNISYKGNLKKRVENYKKKRKETLALDEDEFECEYIKALSDEAKAKLIVLGSVATIIFAIITDLGKIFFKTLFELEKINFIENNQIALTKNMIYLLNGIGIIAFCLIVLIFYFLTKLVMEKINNAIIYKEIKNNKKVRKSTGKFDISGQEIFEGDIIESHIGGRILNQELVIKYGTYQAYCPCDECYMDSIGFYVSGKNLPDMPVGPLEDYAKVVGSTFKE